MIFSPSYYLHILAPLLFSNVALAAFPLVDFDRMGKVGLAGAFAGLDFFRNSSSATSFDTSTSTLLLRSSDGSLSYLASTNSGGSIVAGCVLGNAFYFAGTFSSVGGVTANNVASYTPSSGAFAALGSGGPNGEVDAIHCDSKNSKVWAGGKFTAPGQSVAIWDPKAGSWSSPPFSGIAGASSRVLSITSNSSESSLFFAGSFVTTFQGNGILNSTNNPNVPFSAGATPFSSSLVPIPLQIAEIQGSPSSTNPQFSNIQNILCPSGADGPGNTWLAADENTAVVTVRTFLSMSANGVRLGNTFQAGHGTTGFRVATIPDNKVQTLSYVDPTTGQNETCSDPCPLLTDSSVLYQDFLFQETLGITGVQITLSEWTGSGPGLHLLQLLSSGAFASAIDSNNGVSCFAPNPSNTTRTGDWEAKVANTDIAGTVQSVLVSTVDVGTSASAGPSFTWIPYVSASGQYDVNLLVPGCTNFQDCGLRTSVKVTVFPGEGLQPWVSTISQQNTADATTLIYSGPILPSSPNFVTTVSMTLADSPAGTGSGGKYEIVADRVQMVLKSATTVSNGSVGGNGTQGTKNGFGFFEWPLNTSVTSSTINPTTVMPNSTQTSLDAVGFDMFTAIGGNTPSSTFAISAVAQHSSGAVFLGGNFSLSSGTASGSTNVVAFKNGALAPMAGNGLNGPVTSFVLEGDNLFVGGSFHDTTQGSSQGKLRGIALYDVQKNEWNALGEGVNGQVTSLGFTNGQVQATGNFTKLLTSTTTELGVDAAGLATWDVKASTWVNSGGFLVGSMTLIANGTSSQFVAGNVVASQRFGASGMVMLSNGNSDGPKVMPLGIQLDSSDIGVGAQSASRRRSPLVSRAPAWISHVKLPQLFSRQTSPQLAPLPATLPAPAPAVLAGTFWTNDSSSAEVAVIGGNFSFTPSGSVSGSAESQGVAIYDPRSTTLSGLQGPQVNGTVRSLFIDGDQLYVGGEFTLPGSSLTGLAIYDLSKRQWVVSGIQPLQPSSGTAVVVRSITKSSFKANTIIVAGSFAQAGSLACQSICAFDAVSKQWNTLGSGILGEVASVAYAGNDQDLLIAAGSIALSDNTVANVARFSFANSTWTAVGAAADLPGPVVALEVNGGNASSIFAAGQLTDSAPSVLSFWNGVKWTTLGSTPQGKTTVAQLTMVPLQDTHTANGVIEPDRMLMVSGSLADPSFGNASSALFDGQSFIPFFVSSTSSGASGSISSLFRSLSSFSFNQRRFLATGVVILISIAIAAGVVFFLALIGILWTLFSRRDDKLTKFDTAAEDDDDSTHHRPSSLLEHINAATRTTILGATSPFNNFNAEKEEEKIARDAPPSAPDQDPFGPDASNYVRAETPSDAMGGIMAEETSRPAHARYSFDGEGEGELPISAGTEVEVLDDRDPAWWLARDVRTGREGVVPAAYLY